MEKSNEWYTIFGILVGIIFTYYYQVHGLLIIIVALVILIIIPYRKSLWGKIICNLCRGKGKLKCDCWDVFTSGHGSSFNISKNNYEWKIKDVSIQNNGLPRKVTIRFDIKSKYNNSLKEKNKIDITKTTTRDVKGHDVTYIDLENCLDVKLGNCKNIERLLDRPLKESDFETDLYLEDIKPEKNCKLCKGNGFTKCTKCNGLRINIGNKQN